MTLHVTTFRLHMLLLLLLYLVPTTPLSLQDTNTIRRLVLIGGGHAHVQVIKSLNVYTRPKNLHVTLIDRQPSASYSGMVPGWEQTLIRLKPLAKWAGIEFVKDEVIDISEEKVLLKNGDAVSYDAVSVDVGSSSRGLEDVIGVREFAIPTRPINKLIQRIEEVEKTMERNDDVKVVVVGGGAAGIELSLAMRARWNSLCDSLSVTLLDAGKELLPNETLACRSALLSILSSRNISVKHECIVSSIDTSTIHLENEEESIPYTHCLWATGATPHKMLTQNLQNRDIALDQTGWIRVHPTLQSVSHPNIFAAGDCAEIENLPDNRPSPPKAGVYAVRSGPILIQNLSRYLCTTTTTTPAEERRQQLVSYVPQDDFLKLIMCGDGHALGFRFGIPLYGKWVWQLKNRIDTMFMDLFKEENLPVVKDGEEMDTRQYDEMEMDSEKLNVNDAATMLLRVDDDVEYEKAWKVLRDMMKDDGYRESVLGIVRERGISWIK